MKKVTDKELIRELGCVRDNLEKFVLLLKVDYPVIPQKIETDGEDIINIDNMEAKFV